MIKYFSLGGVHIIKPFIYLYYELGLDFKMKTISCCKRRRSALRMMIVVFSMNWESQNSANQRSTRRPVQSANFGGKL